MITADKARENVKNYFNNLCLDSKQFKVANEILTAVLNKIALSSADGYNHTGFYHTISCWTDDEEGKEMYDILNRDGINNDYSIQGYIRSALIGRGFSVAKCSVTHCTWDMKPVAEILVEVSW